jgi:hypothetical protein
MTGAPGQVRAYVTPCTTQRMTDTIQLSLSHSGTGVPERQLDSAGGPSRLGKGRPCDATLLQIVAAVATMLGQEAFRLLIVVDTATTPQLCQTVLIKQTPFRRTGFHRSDGVLAFTLNQHQIRILVLQCLFRIERAGRGFSVTNVLRKIAQNEVEVHVDDRLRVTRAKPAR